MGLGAFSSKTDPSVYEGLKKPDDTVFTHATSSSFCWGDNYKKPTHKLTVLSSGLFLPFAVSSLLSCAGNNRVYNSNAVT